MARLTSRKVENGRQALNLSFLTISLMNMGQFLVVKLLPIASKGVGSETFVSSGNKVMVVAPVALLLATFIVVAVRADIVEDGAGGDAFPVDIGGASSS